MRAGICVRDPGHNVFSWFAPDGAVFQFDKSHPAAGKHVEQQCFEAVKARYGGDGHQLPQNAIVVVYCPWSPCPSCTTLTGEFVREIGAKGKGIQVKMLFQRFYCEAERLAANYRSAKGTWASTEVAKAAYETLVREFGPLTLPSFSQGGTKTRNVLLVAELDPAKARTGAPPTDRAVPPH